MQPPLLIIPENINKLGLQPQILGTVISQWIEEAESAYNEAEPSYHISKLMAGKINSNV